MAFSTTLFDTFDNFRLMITSGSLFFIKKEWTEIKKVIDIVSDMFTEITHQAEVAELADAHDSKSCSFGSVGSTPTFGTKKTENVGFSK